MAMTYEQWAEQNKAAGGSGNRRGYDTHIASLQSQGTQTAPQTQQPAPQQRAQPQSTAQRPASQAPTQPTQPAGGGMDYGTWEAQARANAGRDWNQADAQNQYRMYQLRREGVGDRGAAQRTGQYIYGDTDSTGLRAHSQQYGMGTDRFEGTDDATLQVWKETAWDENCPPNTPFQAYDGSGCVEKPIDSNTGRGRAAGGAGWERAEGGGGGGAGGGAGGGGGAGAGGSGTPLYGYLGSSALAAAQDPNEALGLLGMSGGIGEYQAELDQAMERINMMAPGPAKDAALARLREQQATGGMALGQAAQGLARGEIQGLVDLEENKRQANLQNRQFYSGLGEQRRQFDRGLSSQESMFGQQLGWDQSRFGQELGWDRERFGQEMDYNRWATEGGWAHDKEMQGTYGQKQRGQAGKMIGSVLGGALGTFGGPLGTMVGSGLGGAIGGMFSDIRVKEDIKPETVGLSAMRGIPTFSFKYKEEVADDPRAGRGRKLGVMAQDVEKVLPSAVTETPDGIKMIQPMGLLAMTMNSVKELDDKIEALSKKRKGRK